MSLNLFYLKEGSGRNIAVMLRLFLLALSAAIVWGHGRLVDPPGRSTMWRYGFKNPPNYNDNELFCGGFGRQWGTNNGKCGICGDAYDLPEPRPNEDGGKYGNGIIVRTYKAGSVITVAANLTANHAGYFEYKICPVTPGVKSDQECLDKYPLELADGSGTQYRLPSRKSTQFAIDVKLPAGLTCDRCVLQWHYRTANRWAKCPDGRGSTGCGPQETFRGCADVKIEA